MNEIKYSVTEVEVADIPPLMRPGRGIWHTEAEKIILRLEKTPPSKALKLNFHGDVKLATRAGSGLRRAIIRRKGKGSVEIKRRGSLVFIHRNGRWDSRVP